MTKAAVSQFFTMKKAFIVRFAIIAGIVLVSLPSCKTGESCDAYQGSSRGSARSHKKKRTAEVVRELPQSYKLA